MIVGVRGKVEHKDLTKIHLDVNGLIYKIFISINSSGNIKEGEELKLHTTFIVREDSQSLYGFIDINEKKMFDTLIKISGVGPKVAMAVCSTFLPDTFAKIITLKDTNLLTKVAGIGLKGANKILLELSDFKIEDSNIQNSSFNEATQALEALGFKKDLILKTLQSCDTTDTSSLVKEALQKIQKTR